MSDLVTITKIDGVADVRLNRPDKYNALSGEMFEAIIAAGESLRDAKDVRASCCPATVAAFAPVSTSRAFKVWPAAMSARRAPAPERCFQRLCDQPENRAQRPAMIWKRLPVPVIAAVHGVAYGGGCQIALGADIRIASPDAKISVMEIKWGLIPDMSLTQTLRDLVPLDVAKELTFSGRVLSGTEAKALGLVTRVADDPLQAALDLAREIAGKSPDAIRAAKQLFEVAWHADPATGLELEQSLQGALIGTPNQIEAVKANFEKRAPAFKNPS